MKLKPLTFVILAAALTGCLTQDGDNIHRINGRPTYETKSLAITETVEQMLKDPRFSGAYEAAREIAAQRKHKLPTILIKPIEDNTQAGGSDSLSTGQIYRELQIALGRSEKFTVVDYALLIKRIPIDINGPDIGVESVNVQNFGKYLAADFVMTCEVRREDDRYFFLNMQVLGPDGGIAFDTSVRFKQ